jgi:hypothetical protein
MEAVAEDKGMKQETFDASKMWWSLREVIAVQPLSGHQSVFVFEGDAEPRGDISDVPSALPLATIGSECGSVMAFQVYLTRQE